MGPEVVKHRCFGHELIRAHLFRCTSGLKISCYHRLFLLNLVVFFIFSSSAPHSWRAFSIDRGLFMRRMVRGRMYDTDTAKRLFVNKCGQPDDEDYVNEALYRKRSGEHFLAGEGGKASLYGVWTNEGRQGGSAIIPLSYNKAQAWCEKNGHELPPPTSAMKEGTSDKVVISSTMPSDLWVRVCEDAMQFNLSKSAMLTMIVEGFYKDVDDRREPIWYEIQKERVRYK